jgi:hypothetical protein
MPCYGLENNEDSIRCIKCPHKTGCAELMGTLKNHVSIDKTRFSFIPLQMVSYANTVGYTNDPDADCIEATYVLCHEWVFDSKSTGSVGNHKALILTRASESGTSLKLFILANMLGWKQSHPAQTFHAVMLTNAFAVHQVKVFASTCSKLYGSFNSTTLDKMTGSGIEEKDIETQILNSEVMAGSWIVEYKLHNSGAVSQNLYARKEMALHPYWLAIEPSYYRDVLSDYIQCNDPSLSSDIRRHRGDAVRIMGRLKTHPRLALSTFRIREHIMSRAVTEVLSTHGMGVADLLVDANRDVTSSIKFWTSVAVAIQQLECLRFVNRLPSIYDGRA